MFPVFYGFIDSWLPSYGVALSDQVLNCTDGLTLLALPYITRSYYQTQVIADGAAGMWMFSDPAGSAHWRQRIRSALNPLIGFGAAVTGLSISSFGQPGLLGSDNSTSCAVTTGSFETGGATIAFPYSGTGGLTLEGMVQVVGFGLATWQTSLMKLTGSSAQVYQLYIDQTGTLFYWLGGSVLTTTSDRSL